MVAYILAASELAPGTDRKRLAAASAVIMLAASLPISFGGWGIRELGAVLALGTIGLPAEKALIVAVLIGMMSMLAPAAIFVGTFALSTPMSKTGRPRTPTVEVDFRAVMAWLLPLAVATTVFFQVQVPVGNGTKLNVNLADPFAICGGILFVLAVVRSGHWPKWRLDNFNGYFLAATIVMTAGLLIGWHSFGWTAWAFTSKYLGWFVLLGYAATGALLVSTGGTEGETVLIRTFLGAGVAIALVEIALVVLKSFGTPIDDAVSAVRDQRHGR